MSTVKATKLTYEAYMALPETKERCEVVDGVLFVAPSALPDHQWIAGVIFTAPTKFVMAGELGVMIVAPSDLLAQRELLRVRQPDVMFFSAERTGFRGRLALKDLPIFEVPPDIVVEVLSPSNTGPGFQEKIEDYRRFGVLECWLVDPAAETVRVLDLTGATGSEAGSGRVETLESKVLQGFALPLAEIFG